MNIHEVNDYNLTQSMTDQQKLVFMSRYQAVRKDLLTAILLAVFLGSFGAHRFYLGENKIALLYILFCWTGIPHLIAWIECFFLPDRIRRYNATAANLIALQITTGVTA